ncbi:MAG: diacylglycerol kinase family lipid kinase [Bacteroidales bacterium]|jgi:YegS/Rv2252/BmrU family lipid kinase|nr:diacylglycerol kinase family lipid kinase [Bacteroidales bacterium]
MSEKICFILNPISGFFHFRRKKIEKHIQSQIKKGVVEGDIFYSQYAGHTTVIAAEAIVAKYDKIVVAGGDGSINEAASALIHSGIPLGILPAGSGNGLARHLKLPFNIKKAMRVIQQDAITQIDAMNVNGKYAFSVAGSGMDAQTAQLYKKFRSRGLITYLYAAVKTYFHFQPETITYQQDGKTITQQSMLVLLSNSNQFGYNFRLAPDANVSDGLVDVVIIPPLKILPILAAFPAILTGNANKIRSITRFQCDTLQINRTKENPINIDGDSLECGALIEMKVVKDAVKIIGYN